MSCLQAPQSQPEDTTDGNGGAAEEEAEDISTWMHEGVHARVFPPAGAPSFASDSWEGRLLSGIDSDGEVRLQLSDGSETEYFHVMSMPHGNAEHKPLCK
eukprot:COSAG01_NODE_1000_length_12213_cov_20.853063_16_plen_100_part_00